MTTTPETDTRRVAVLVANEGIELVEAGVLSGRTVTSWPSLQTDVRNAGGTWVDEEVVRDDRLVTSRKPDDLPAFNDAVLDLLGGR